MVSYSNNIYRTNNNNSKKILPLLKQNEFRFYQPESVSINFIFFLLPFQSLFMSILILLPLDDHNFKIITKPLQNQNLLFMKTINQDLVPREFSFIIRWSMRIIPRQEALPPYFSRDTGIHNISPLISVPTVIELMCVKNVKYLKFRFC